MGLPEKVALFDYINSAVDERLHKVPRTNARDVYSILLKNEGCNKNPELTIETIVEHLERANGGNIQRPNDAKAYIQAYRETGQYTEKELRQFIFYERKKKK